MLERLPVPEFFCKLKLVLPTGLSPDAGALNPADARWFGFDDCVRGDGSGTVPLHAATGKGVHPGFRAWEMA